MKNQAWSYQAGRTFLHIAVAGTPSASTEAESRQAIATALAHVETAGLDPNYLARSRLWARDATARQTASDVRRELLSGDIRAASASFIAPDRLPGDAAMMIELTVLSTNQPDAPKIIREYDPPIVPPMFVAFDGMVFFSGNTDKSPGLESQLANVHNNFDGFLEIAGTSWENTTEVSVFLASSEATQDGRYTVLSHLPALQCPYSITLVDGFSAPEKRVEIEVSARLA